MTRQEYIEKVKVKLDEVSPFEEPLTFIAADGDSSYDKVKPISIYIEKELDNAVYFCLKTLPLKVLSKDIKKEERELVTNEGVGNVVSSNEERLCRVRVNGWERDVITFSTPEDARYSLQQNKHTRSGIARPSVFYNPEESMIELFSVPADFEADKATIWSIDLATKAEDVKSDISDFIVLKCAQLVLDILGSQNSSIMEKELVRKVTAL